MVTECSTSYLLIMCPKNTACLFRISLTSYLIFPALSSTSPFLILFTYEILSILQRHQISIAFNQLSLSLFIVHAAQLHINTCNISQQPSIVMRTFIDILWLMIRCCISPKTFFACIILAVTSILFFGYKG